MNKKILIICTAAVIGISMISCKSKQSVTEISSAHEPATVETPAVQETTPATTPAEREVTRSEAFKLAAGETNTAAMSKKYHVQVGAFTVHDNARNLRAKLVNEGNDALVVENDRGMLRVIIASYNTYQEARAKINQIRDTYPDAWVLVQSK
jgi:cell division protein FtsN